MRLTNQLREQIISDIVDALTTKEETTLKKRESALGIQCYNHLFTKRQRDIMNELPRGWLPEDTCLQFNVGGMAVSLTTDKPVRVPFRQDVSVDETVGTYRSGCKRLGNIADEELKQKFLGLHSDQEALKVKVRKMRTDTKAMLDSVQTYAQLEKNWPEGKKFYGKYKPKHGDSQLPAIRVQELNKTLGLGA